MTDTIVTNNQTLLHVNMTNVTKLTQTNFLMWKLQVRALVDGHGLIGHLDGSCQIPPSTITTNDVVSENPAYVAWKRQDQLVYSALLGSISLTVQPLLSRTTMASEIWSTLADTFAKPSRGHVQQIKDQLKAWTKGNRTIDEYLQGLTTWFDTLASLGKPLEHDDQIEIILDGLPEDYRPVIDQIEARDVSPTIAYVHERLRNREAKLLSKAAPSIHPVTANVAMQRHNNNSRGGSSNRNRSNNNNSTQSASHNSSSRSDQRSYRPYLGKCQYCNVQGHSARRCPQLQHLSSSSGLQQRTLSLLGSLGRILL
ncbi:PREDICTED: uncharacterized protein LOC104733670 [Camelina sativa]|uniref:Uncharacterized protein LOC104733670 n=1 Tax=Camelina sativa TaxID=90675 RepID=A0ABM0V6C2_CAMSA|nr:PREDICTED: uncharacterized protein LOC104733670 [Camelina sativa]